MQRMRRELQQQLEREAALRNDVAALQQQLSDANQGLRAAARLSDQLEAGQQTIAVLRDEGECKCPEGNISINMIIASFTFSPHSHHICDSNGCVGSFDYD